MKIIFLDFDDVKNPLLGAGQAHATYNVGGELVKRGHEVVSVCSRYPGYKDRVENGIQYKHIGLGSSNIKLNNFVYIFSVPFYLVRAKADIVIECFTAPISTMFSPLFTKIPVVALPSMFNAKEFTKKYRLPFHLVEKLGIKHYKYMLPYSEVDSAKAKKLNPNILYKIVSQGVGEEYFKIKSAKKKHILFLSRFDINQKGIDLLLEAYAKVKDKINYPLVITGHGPDGEKIKSLAKKLNIENKVNFVGSAYGEKKFKLMSEAVFVAFPSRHDEMCLWTLEALAGSLPIVCFDIPESKWIGRNVSFKAKAFNIDDYSERLLEAASTPKIEKMSKDARDFAKNFKWSNVAKEFESFFKKILKEEENG